MRIKKKRGLKPYVLMAAVSFIIFISVSGFLFFDLFFDREKVTEIEIPNLVGIPDGDFPVDSRITVEKKYVFSDGAEKGIVISQSRRGRVKIRDGESVALEISVSLGKEKRILPDLCGLDIYEASGIIRELGCIPKTVFSESEKRADSVIFSLPRANSELHYGEVVTIYVAKRETGITVTVPDFYGCAMNDIQERVETAGLTVGKVEFIYSEDFLPNTVVYQSVGTGCLVKQGERVDLYVSRLPQN